MKKLSELPLGIYEKAICSFLSWEEKLLLAKDSGFDFVEMGIDGTPDRSALLYDKSASGAVNAAVAATGVPIYTMAMTANRAYPLGSEDGEVREKGLDLVRRAIALAAETGIEVVHLAGYDELGQKCCERTRGLFRESMEQAVRMAEGTPVTLAIETMDAPFMGSCSNVVRLCRELGSEKLRCYADVGNLTAMGLDMPEELRTGAGYIVGLHLKDATPGVCRDVPFGGGIVDFDAAFSALRDTAYGGYMAAEAWSYDRESFHPYLKTISGFLRNRLKDY